MELIKVGRNSKTRSVAGYLADVLRRDGNAEIQAVGAGAVNQTVKAVAVCRGFVAPEGIDLTCTFGFVELDEPHLKHGDECTAIRFVVEAHK